MSDLRRALALVATAFFPVSGGIGLEPGEIFFLNVSRLLKEFARLLNAG